jgi:hypothetical protein
MRREAKEAEERFAKMKTETLGVVEQVQEGIDS